MASSNYHTNDLLFSALQAGPRSAMNILASASAGSMGVATRRPASAPISRRTRSGVHNLRVHAVFGLFNNSSSQAVSPKQKELASELLSAAAGKSQEEIAVIVSEMREILVFLVTT